MRNLKTTKKVFPNSENFQSSSTPKDVYSEELISPIDRHEYAMSQFEEKTGLKDGAKVRFIGVSDEQMRYWNNRYTDPLGILNSDTIYEIEHIVIGRSYTVIKLVGFRKEKFSGAMFEALDKKEPKKDLQPGDSVRYIGYNKKDIGEDNIKSLIYETIYTVESIGNHPSYMGFKLIKLVGFEGCEFDRMLFEKVTENK